jgi:transcriptional regulator with XRE-family HTH domain
VSTASPRPSQAFAADAVTDPPQVRSKRRTPTGDAVGSMVAANVRKARGERGWTLDELAARCGVSKGMLVAIEQRRTNPSIQTLTRVADSLGVTLAWLVSLPDTPTLRVVPAGDGAELWKSSLGSVAKLLIATGSPARLEFWEWVIVPGDAYLGEPEMIGSIEIVHVHEGRLALTVGEDKVVLDAGASVLIEPGAPRVFANAGAEILRYCQAFAAASSLASGARRSDRIKRRPLSLRREADAP